MSESNAGGVRPACIPIKSKMHNRSYAMTPQKINPFSPEYRNTFGNSYIRQFEVYTNQAERVGQVIDAYLNEAGRLQALIVKLVAPPNKQILLPLNQTIVDQQRQRVYVNGLTKAELINLPNYESSQLTQQSQVPGETAPVSPLEASAPLDASMAMDDRRTVYPAPVVPPPTPTSAYDPTIGRTNYLSDRQFGDQIGGQFNAQPSYAPQPDPGTTIRLHEERLVVDRGKRRKVGEVVVRKEIETRMVEVPVRREKLIVEQISPTYEQVAVIDLNSVSSELEVTDSSSGQPSVSGEFTSAEAASRFLDAIAHHPSAGHQTIQIRILLKDAAEQATYQQWLERYL